MNILVIGYVWPEPASSAAGYRMLALLDTFRRQDWHVTFASPAEKSIHRADLPARGIQEVNIALNCTSFDTFISELQPDMVMFDRFMMEEQFGWRVEKHCPQAVRLLDTEDLSCLRHARHQACKHSGEVSVDVPRSLLFSDHAKREVAAILRSDLTLMISPTEIELLTQTFKVDPALLHDSPFMLPPVTSEQQAALPAFEQRQNFIVIGNFRHAPNWDAVLWLKQTLWPLIRARLPDAELHVYGAYPPPKATQLHNPAQGFLVKGWADDALEVMRTARVNLAPLRFGAGLKGKLVDALACGTPSVTTSIGAEGMAGDHDWPQPVTDDPATFAAHAIELYTDANTWHTRQQQGWILHNRRFDFTLHADALVARLQDLQDNLEQHRLDNFTGAMLRHHSMKSTQYMAQWIEAKNRS
ncbi:glycosyltransferase involved in cell wall biosynthesis [Marinobacterium halophilum]|uniref:Glycosyltransferase involved in cell wall biosynthesis n=1 Tax=Marinobacterium halophilum TaxID=267374 RepID=A0A2P8EIV3_9GAMM|nr:glycosyltransferase [Marinobacterium halophilum]PSL09383.1 glycosyltransferase involved in cell wall biosynthesis [Marinobacterium halophilum]